MTSSSASSNGNDLQAIRDHLALCEAKARYCRLLDTKDWEGWRELFTEVFELDVSEGTGQPIIKGRDAAMASVLSSIRDAVTAHQVHSPEIRLDGDEAEVVWAMQDRVIFAPNRPSITGYGHYHERWVRQDGRWRIASLRLTRLHIDVHPPQGA